MTTCQSKSQKRLCSLLNKGSLNFFHKIKQRNKLINTKLSISFDMCLRCLPRVPGGSDHMYVTST